MAAERIANRYAKALMDLCEGDLEKAKTYRDAFKAISKIFDNDDVRRVLSSPVVGADLKREVLKEVSQQINADKLLSLFLDAVGEANRVGIVPNIYHSLNKLILKQEGVVEANIATAFQLEDADLKSVQSSLESMTGKKVQLSSEVDKSILGGLVVRIENSVLDMSLKTKLDAMTKSAVS